MSGDAGGATDRAAHEFVKVTPPPVGIMRGAVTPLGAQQLPPRHTANYWPHASGTRLDGERRRSVPDIWPGRLMSLPSLGLFSARTHACRRHARRHSSTDATSPRPRCSTMYSRANGRPGTPSAKLIRVAPRYRPSSGVRWTPTFAAASWTTASRSCRATTATKSYRSPILASVVAYARHAVPRECLRLPSTWSTTSCLTALTGSQSPITGSACPARIPSASSFHSRDRNALKAKSQESA